MGDFDDDDFDVVVIGSGFGGSVSAYELASRGLRVCLLERGKAFPPGSFARTPSEMAHNLWDPSEGLHGMFNVWSFKGIDALTASGLGGGSLIYANVMLRKDPSWFVQHHPYRKNVIEQWPISYDDLEPHYRAVEKFLDVQTFPDGADIPKAAALDDAARQIGMGDTFHKAPLAVRFVGRVAPSTRANRWRATSTRTSSATEGRHAGRAGSAASATSDATTGPRTRSITRTCRPPPTSVR